MRASHDIAISWIRSTWLKLVGRLKVQRRKDRQFVKRREVEKDVVRQTLCHGELALAAFSCVMFWVQLVVTLGGQIACDQLRLLSGYVAS